jgi:hypothetical protein
MCVLYKSLFFVFFVFPTILYGMEEQDSNSHSRNKIFPPLTTDKVQKENKLHLVVGSSRKTSTYINPYAEKIFGKDIDLTHRKTFNGQAITLDLRTSSDGELPHIQGDACSYTPSEGTRFRAVFMELFPSIRTSSRVEIRYPKPGKEAGQELSDLMLMPHAIQNLSKYMKEGDSIEIEHLPLLTSLGFTVYHEIAATLKKYNPFHGILSPFFMENMNARNYEGIKEKVAYWKLVRERKVSFLQWDEETSKAIMGEAIRNHVFVLQAIQNIKTLLPTEQIQQRLNIEFNIYKANPNDFFSQRFVGSLSELIAWEFTMLSQQDSLKNFFKRNGFGGVKIERKDNPYNGRRNVWMISAMRNSEPIASKEEF